MTPYPISKVCPQCGSREYTTQRPDRFFTLDLDRVCKACETRYTPPTSIAAGVGLLLVGILGVFGAVYTVGDLLKGNMPEAIGGAVVGLLGVLALIHGIRVMIWPGQV
jgi:hypothetical protein